MHALSKTDIEVGLYRNYFATQSQKIRFDFLRRARKLIFSILCEVQSLRPFLSDTRAYAVLFAVRIFFEEEHTQLRLTEISRCALKMFDVGLIISNVLTRFMVFDFSTATRAEADGWL